MSADIVRYSAAVQTARLRAVRDAIDAAATPGRFVIYAGSESAPGEPLPADAVELVSYPLSRPCGVIIDGMLSFTLPAEQMVMADGVAAWAQFEDGDGGGVLNMDVGDMRSGAAVRVQQINLYAGGILRPVLAKLT